MTWQPIETVPEDGTFVDLWWHTTWDESFRVPDCRYRNEETFIDDGGNIIERQYVTHWMALPDPPDSA